LDGNGKSAPEGARRRTRASIVRAAGVFNRNTIAVRNQARKLGTPFPPMRVVRKKWAGTLSNQWRKF
jgi:hypothetical protein